MQTAGRTRRSTGIWSVVQVPPAWTGASRWVPKCSSEANFPEAKPPPFTPDRENTFSPDQLGSLSERGWPRSTTRPAPSAGPARIRTATSVPAATSGRRGFRLALALADAEALGVLGEELDVGHEAQRSQALDE